MILSDEDARIVQLVSAGFLTCGLVVTLAIPLVFPSVRSVKDVTRKNTVYWSPRGFLGSEGRSPIFGVAWGLIYASQLYLAIGLLIASLQNLIVSDSIGLLNACACVFSATALSAFWTPLFTISRPWTFAASSALLIVCATFATIGVIASKPFFHGVVWLDAGLAVLSVFAGWAITAAAISVGITTRVYSRGIDSDGLDEFSLYPIIDSIVLAVLAIVFGNPVIPAPLFVATFFMPIQKWSIWVATVICALGIGVGVAMAYLYKGTGLFW
jgi:hypothetical protein